MLTGSDTLCKLAVSEHVDEPGPCHTLIASGSAIHSLFFSNQLSLDHLRHVIVDEADSVLKLLKRYSTFKQEKCRAVHPVPAQLFLEQLVKLRPRTRMLFASATMNSELKHHLKRSRIARPGSVFVEAGDAPPSKLMESHWECPRSINHLYSICDIDNMEQLAGSIAELVRREQGRPGIVIVPESVKRLPLLQSILSFNVDAALMSDYTHTDPSQRTAVWLGTDADIRGLDIPTLNYVIIVGGECDGGVAGYVHSVGRVGRMGRPGTAYTLIKRENELISYLAMLRHKLNAIALPVSQVSSASNYS
jgi:superfamily II DNA/RNA helicase